MFLAIYFALVIILIFAEIAVLKKMAAFIVRLKELNRNMPEVQKRILFELKRIRKEFRRFNNKLVKHQAMPLSGFELGQMFGGLVFKLLVFRKFSLFEFISVIYKNKERLMPTLTAFNTSSSLQME